MSRGQGFVVFGAFPITPASTLSSQVEATRTISRAGRFWRVAVWAALSVSSGCEPLKAFAKGSGPGRGSDRQVQDRGL